MKKMIVLFLLFAGLSQAISATDIDKISKQAKETFNSRFPNATATEWFQLEKNEVYQVNFVYNNQRLVSFIDWNGKLLGFARSVMNESLPYLVNEALANRYKDFIISSIEELIMDEQVSYVFNIENDKLKIYGTVSTRGTITVIKKTSKSK